MQAVILVLVVIGISFAVVSGVWVAIALVSAISTRRTMPAARCQSDKKSSN